MGLLLPALHLCACLITYVGFLLPSVQFFGMVFDFVTSADYPISLIAWNNPSFVVLWTVLGTLWWYLLSRGVEALLVKFGRKNNSSLISAIAPFRRHNGAHFPKVRLCRSYRRRNPQCVIWRIRRRFRKNTAQKTPVIIVTIASTDHGYKPHVQLGTR